jgi:hypothetical protein
MKHIHFILSGLGVFIGCIGIVSLLAIVIGLVAYSTFVIGTCFLTHPVLFLIVFAIPIFWVIGWFKAEKEKPYNP